LHYIIPKKTQINHSWYYAITHDNVKNTNPHKSYLSALSVSSSSLAPLFCGGTEEWSKQNMLLQNYVASNVTSRTLASTVIMWF